MGVGGSPCWVPRPCVRTFFSHVREGGPGGFCWHFANGKCKFGVECAKRHWTEPKREEMGGRQCVDCTPVRAAVAEQVHEQAGVLDAEQAEVQAKGLEKVTGPVGDQKGL